MDLVHWLSTDGHTSTRDGPLADQQAMLKQCYSGDTSTRESTVIGVTTELLTHSSSLPLTPTYILPGQVARSKRPV